MARQASEDTHHPFPGLYEWHKRWLEERTRYPSYMEVRINEHLWQNKEVFVFVFPDTDRRDILGCFADPRYRDKGYEIPMCVVHEPLSQESRSHLNTLLSPITQLQGVDYREALAFSVQIFLMFVDYQRAMQEEESVLFGLTSEQFLYTTEGLIRLVQIVNSPMLTLEALFKFWGIIGVHFASGFYKSPDASLGQPTYLTIPPTWFTVDQLTEMYGDEAETRRIPILVEPPYKALTERFLKFYRAHSQAGVSLHLSFGVHEKGRQAGNIGDQAPAQKAVEKRTGFQFAPDFRSVSLHGQEFSLTSHQAQVVEQLYKAYDNGTPEVGQNTLIVGLELQSRRLSDIFRSRKEAWGKLIVPGKTRGTYRLNI